MDSNFSKSMAGIIWIIGTMGGLACGTLFAGDATYNWGLALAYIISSIITGGLFMSIGILQESLDRNNYLLSNIHRVQQETAQETEQQ